MEDGEDIMESCVCGGLCVSVSVSKAHTVGVIVISSIIVKGTWIIINDRNGPRILKILYSQILSGSKHFPLMQNQVRLL